MDSDGFTLLIERDYEEFTAWEKRSKKMSLEELKDNYNKWRQKMKDVTEKYGFSIEREHKDNISTFMVQLTYFYYLAMFCWKSLHAYTEKLQKDHDALTKSKKGKTAKVNSKRKIPSKKRNMSN